MEEIYQENFNEKNLLSLFYFFTFKLTVCMLNKTADIIKRTIDWARDHHEVHHATLAAMSHEDRAAFAARAHAF